MPLGSLCAGFTFPVWVGRAHKASWRMCGARVPEGLAGCQGTPEPPWPQGALGTEASGLDTYLPQPLTALCSVPQGVMLQRERFPESSPLAGQHQR